MILYILVEALILLAYGFLVTRPFFTTWLCLFLTSLLITLALPIVELVTLIFIPSREDGLLTFMLFVTIVTFIPLMIISIIVLATIRAIRLSIHEKARKKKEHASD